MTTVEEIAPAKVNLSLHVTGRRADGYHLLDSLVVFAEIADRVTAAPGDGLSLTVSGPFAEGVPLDARNSMIRAARALAAHHGIAADAALHLDKRLPHAAGIGSASSDAAATLRALGRLWDVGPLPGPEVLALGADVPVCLRAPAPTRLSGIGEVLTPAGPLPPAALVFVNPRVEVPTGAVFAALERVDTAPIETLPRGGFDALAAWVGAARNDLWAPALSVAPALGPALRALVDAPGIAAETMSGSGATCVGLAPDMKSAEQIARALGAAHPGWWVDAARILS